jgi:[acyl-carrier-protein] S-malonyltransferase
MGRDLCDSLESARRVLARADEVLGFSLTQVMFEGPEEVLRQTRNAQPAILALSVAVWEALDLSPESEEFVAAGHSLGEYSAYVAAGAFRFEDALRVVRQRGELMYEAGRARPGTMAAVLGADPETVVAVCAETAGIVCPANFNSPAQIVISGEKEAVRRAGSELSGRGAKKVKELEVSGAFHSPLMESAAKGLQQALAAVEIADARFPVYANATAEPVVTAAEIRISLVRQLLNPVLWEPTIRTLAGLGVAESLEIGPGRVLKGLLRSTDRSLSCRALGTAAEVIAFNEGR